jgi:cytoskeletal protein CcmA (bactofilin family)
VANRKITQFPAINPVAIVDQDLVTLVSVFEIDPALRNKKLNFSGLRVYLDQYYINQGETDPFTVGNVLVTGYAAIYGDENVRGNLTVSGTSVFESNVEINSSLFVGNNISVTGNIVANQVAAQNLLGDYLEVTSGNFTIATGTVSDFTSGYFDYASGTTITGDNVGIQSGTVVDLTVTRGIDAVSGYFDYLIVDEFVGSGVTVTGDINANNINATGTISGATITGDIGQFTNITGILGVFDTVSGATVTGDTVLFTEATGTNLRVTSGNFNQLVASGFYGETVTGIVATFTDAYIQNDLTITGNLNITGDLVVDEITAISGDFSYISGATITGDTINADLINVDTLNATNLSFSGDQTVSGSFTIVQNLFLNGSGFIGGDLYVTGLVSGTTITGTSGTFDTFVSAPTISGTDVFFDVLVVSQTATITGDLQAHDITATGNLDVTSGLVVNGTTELSGDLSLSGDFSIVSGNITGDGDTTISGIEYIHAASGLFTNDLDVDGNVIISGNLDVSGTTTFDELNILSGLVVSGDLFVSGQVIVDDNVIVSGNITAITGIFTTVTGNAANFTSGNFVDLKAITVSGTNLNYINVTGITITGENFLGTNGTFTQLAGVTITGTNISTTTGHFGNLLVDNQIITDADLSVSGNAFVTSGVNVGGDVTVSGTVTTHSDFIVLSGQAEFPWGTQTAPGITFTGDLNTGFYNPSGEMIAAAVNGKRGWTIESGTGPSEGRHVLTIWNV